MPEEIKAKLGAVVKATRHNLWKYLGAMFMEMKDGVQAVSFTRVLALCCFVMLMWKWSGITGTIDTDVAEALAAANLDVPLALKASSAVADSLLYTFWGLLGGKTAESMMSLWKGMKGA